MTVFGLALLVVQAAMAATYALGLWRLRAVHGPNDAVAGVSVTTEAVWASVGLGWLLHGLASGSVVVAISGALGLLGASSVLTLAVPFKPSAVPLAAGAGVAMVMVGSLLVGPGALAAALSVIGAAQFWPQAVASLRAVVHGGAPAPVPGVLLRVAFTSGWLVFGLLTTPVDVPVVVYGVVGTGAFVLQLAAALLFASRTGRTPRAE